MSSSNSVLTPVEMAAQYGAFYFAGAKLALDSSKVPPQLHPLLHYAAFWGTADDAARAALVEQASPAIKADLIQVIRSFDDELDSWLAGPEADDASPSDEYVAYSAMRMAADFV